VCLDKGLDYRVDMLGSPDQIATISARSSGLLLSLSSGLSEHIIVFVWVLSLVGTNKGWFRDAKPSRLFALTSYAVYRFLFVC
jgi:hypothetical protein